MNGNSVLYKLLCLYLYKKIISSYKRTVIYYNKDNMETSKLKRNLIICNHDLWPIDILLVPFFFYEYLNIPVSVVVSKNMMDFYINKELFSEYTLIPIGSSTEMIINELNAGKSVILFFNWVNKQNLSTSSSIRKIMTATGCAPVYFTVDLSENISKRYKYHPYIYHYIKNSYKKQIKKKNIKYTYITEYNIKSATNSRLRILQFIFGGPMHIILTSSDICNTYEDVVNNVIYLEKLKLKGNRVIDYNNYTKLHILPELITKYLNKLKRKNITKSL